MRLKVLLSNRCNMMCQYCVVRVNEDSPLYLESARVTQGIAHYLRGVAGADPRSTGISYGGGEPLLKTRIVEDCVAYARRTAPRVRQDLHTNGVLLDRRIYKFLSRHGVKVVVSLDGEEASHDLHRVSYRGRKKTTWRQIQRRMAALPTAEMGVNMVFTPDTVDALARNVGFLGGMGFSSVSVDPDTCHSGRVCGWTQPALERLGRAAAELATFLQTAPRGEDSACEYTILSRCRDEGETPAMMGRREYPWLDTIFLGADGHFYPPGLMNLPYAAASAFRCGDVDRGIDWARLSALSQEAAAFIRAHFGDDRPFYFSPLADYIFAKHAGADAVPIIARHLEVHETLLRPFTSTQGTAAGSAEPPTRGAAVSAQARRATRGAVRPPRKSSPSRRARR